MRNLYKVILILLAIVLCLNVRIDTLDVYSANELTQKQNELKYIQSKIKENQYMIDKLNEESDKVLQEIKEIDQLVRTTTLEIEEIENKIKEKETYLNMINYNKEMNKIKLDTSTQSFQRIVSQLTNATDDPLNWSINTDNWYALNLRLNELTYVYEIYNQVIDNTWDSEVKLNSVQGTIEIELKSIEKEKELLQKKKDFIKDQMDKKIEVFNQIGAEKYSLASYSTQLETYSEELEKTIVKLQSFGYMGSNIVKGKGVMMWPTDGGSISSGYGNRIHPIYKEEKMHTGIDIGGIGYDAPVYASADGIVITAGWLGGYGNTVIIDHGNGISTLYGHNSKLTVKVGQEVKRGDLIAKSGSTGVSTGPHIHFEVRVNGKTVNPLEWL